MRNYPEDEYDRKELERLNVEPWMVDQLALNPSYTCWGPGEDYMPSEGRGWDASIVGRTWDRENLDSLDDLNEVVHFYFRLDRESEDCSSCDGGGYNPATQRIANDFYDFARRGTRWVDKITQDEADALVEAGRCCEFRDGSWHSVPRTAEEINAENRPGARGLGHDAINRGILIEARAKRLGVWGLCEECEGHGYVSTEERGWLGLVLWVLHPRKGASRAYSYDRIQRDDLPSVYAFLREAAKRNAERFARIPKGDED